MTNKIIRWFKENVIEIVVTFIVLGVAIGVGIYTLGQISQIPANMPLAYPGPSYCCGWGVNPQIVILFPLMFLIIVLFAIIMVIRIFFYGQRPEERDV